MILSNVCIASTVSINLDRMRAICLKRKYVDDDFGYVALEIPCFHVRQFFLVSYLFVV